MRRLLLTLTLLLAVTGALAVENQAFLGIFAETSVNRMAGMPDMTEMMKQMPPGMTMPPGVAMPGMPKRALNVRLWSPGLAPKNAFAWLAVPAGLKQGARLDLELYRPEPGKVGGKNDYDPAKVPDFVIKRYWGSSATVKPGQPEIIKFVDLTPEQQAAARDEANKVQDGYFYKPDWTTGYWPTKKQPGAIAPDAVLAGTYALTTNYTGNVALDVPATVQFLNPIEMSAPKLDKLPDLTKPITFKWKTIPGVLGYHAYIMGMQGKNTLITWSSSEVKYSYGLNFDYMQMADVIANVKQTVFMAPDRVEVTVPAGIFKDCDFVNFIMIGYGTAAALAEAQPLPRCQTKTTLTIMLGGKEMEKEMKNGGMDFGGMGDDE